MPERSFARSSEITKHRVPHKRAHANTQRIQRTNFWPGGRLDYEFLERCKEIICRIPHPTGHYRYRKIEYRLSTMIWSRGAYVDIRQYQDGKPTGTGILLHLDVVSELLPELTRAVRDLQMNDTRDIGEKAQVEVIRA